MKRTKKPFSTFFTEQKLKVQDRKQILVVMEDVETEKERERQTDRQKGR
jgi:hypothetical protein